MFSVIGKVKTNHIPSYASVHQTDWAKQNYILKFSLSLAIISGEKLRSQGGGTLLSIQLFSAAILPLLPTKCLEQILPHVLKELLRATQAFWALGRWISDGGGSNVILCKCSLCCPFSVALPRTVLILFLSPSSSSWEWWVNLHRHLYVVSVHYTLFLSLCIRIPKWLRDKLKSISEMQTKLCQDLFSS